MAVPRTTVLEYLLETLKTVTRANGYHTDVQLVELRTRQMRDVNLSEFPAIILTLGQDRPDSETQGNNSANIHFRAWSMALTLALQESMLDSIEVAGEKFLADVQKCLIVNRYGNNGKPSDIQFILSSDEFERMENKTAQFAIGLTVMYDFTIGDL